MNIVIPEWLTPFRRRVLIGFAIFVLVIAGLGAFPPRLVADPATLGRQRMYAEHAIARGYEKAAKQVRDVSALTLAIPREEADQIAAKAKADLDGIRLAAVASIAQSSGVNPAGAEAYARQVAPSLQGNQWDTEPGILLAPPLHAIVVKTTDALQTVADTATRQIARDPKAPVPSPSGR